MQASHSRAPLAVGVVRSEPVILDRVSLSHHVPVSRFCIAPKPSSSPRRLSLPLLLLPAQQRKKSNRHALRSYSGLTRQLRSHSEAAMAKARHLAAAAGLRADRPSWLGQRVANARQEQRGV